MDFVLSYTQVLFDGNWGKVGRPVIEELLAYKDKYRGSFYNQRRAVRVSLFGDDAGEADVDFFLEVGQESYSIEMILPTIIELRKVIDKIRDINRKYKQEEDYASIDLTNIKIENRKGKYYCTGMVQAVKASEDDV